MHSDPDELKSIAILETSGVGVWPNVPDTYLKPSCKTIEWDEMES